MQKKVLFCATVDYHFKAFHLPYLKWFKEQGWEVHIAAAGELKLPYVDKKYNVPLKRSPFQKKNLEAYKDLKKIINEQQFNIIHCHTPMGGVITRLAARNSRKHGTKVIYTAHGFHFCKGAPLTNWMFYYPIEFILSFFTDCLITINQEDYKLAQKHRFKVNSLKHVHGVGVDIERYKPVMEEQKNCLRKSLGYKPNDFFMFYAAEFNKNKNQKLLIESVALIKEKLPNAKLLLAGEGILLQECKQLARSLKVEHMIEFLGFRSDIDDLLKMSDLAVASSLREGLPVNIMEAMACGLPVIANDNRGHRELIENDKNGWIVKNDSIQLSKKIQKVAGDKQLKLKLGNHGRKKVETMFSIQKILDEKSEIYRDYMEELEDTLWAVH